MHSAHIGPLLGQCNHLAKRMMLHHMQRYDFTPVQAHAMMFLIHSAHQEETTQQELERHLKIRPSTANGVVARLEEKGFITRATGKADGRCKQLLLTEKGLCLEDDFDAVIHQAEATMLQGFSTEEREILQSFLQRIIHSLEEESHPC